MGRIEKTVFISYRRNNPWFAIAVFQDLTHHGYDVFIDYNGITSGDFEKVILENIRARAHFLVVLTPSALKRSDWMRREIETALEARRNIVSLTQEGFNFDTPAIKRQLTGSLAPLKQYNAINVPADYFEAAMDKLRKYLNVALDTVLHPASASAGKAAREEQAAARNAPAVTEEELTAQEWFERASNSTDPDEQVDLYTKAIKHNPNFAIAFNNRAIARKAKGDLDSALLDCNEAIRLNPDDADSFYNRGNVRADIGDLDGALQDYNEAIRLNPDYAKAFCNRGIAREAKGDLKGALQDYNKAIRLKPDFAIAFHNRGNARKDKGDLEGALQDYNEAIRLNPDFDAAFYNRAVVWQKTNQINSAISDYQSYLELAGADAEDADKVNRNIRDLQAKLQARK
jgi:tetratricopeptide (TPR) repeat protein